MDQIRHTETGGDAGRSTVEWTGSEISDTDGRAGGIADGTGPLGWVTDHCGSAAAAGTSSWCAVCAGVRCRCGRGEGERWAEHVRAARPGQSVGRAGRDMLAAFPGIEGARGRADDGAGAGGALRSSIRTSNVVGCRFARTPTCHPERARPAALGLEPATIAVWSGGFVALSPFQVQLWRSAVTLLVLGRDE